MRESFATFTFAGTLADFVPSARGNPIRYGFRGSPAVKDAIEALGVPHVEVNAILVNGKASTFDRPLQGGDQVWVHPHDAPPECASWLHLQPSLPEAITFLADVHLGRLARTLRLLGFDTLHDGSWTDAAVVRIARAEDRIVLTRDRQILKHGNLLRGYWVRSTDPHTQIREVVLRFDLAHRARPFSRCSACNGLLRHVAKEIVLDRIPPRTALWRDEYVECPSCLRLYWWGSHAERLRHLVESALGPRAL